MRAAMAVAPYSFENKSITLEPSLEKKLRANKAAWDFFQSQPPWYRRNSVFWVMSAKRDETRARRFDALLDACVKRHPIHPFARNK